MTQHNRGLRLPGQVLSADDVRALLAQCRRGRTGVRNRALLVTLWRAGLRTSEALALMPEDLDPDAGLVYVRRGKGGKPRVAGMDPEAFAAVAAWLAARPAGPGPVFCSLEGKPLSTGYCRTMIARLARKARLRRRVHLHGLRHSCAVGMLREGATLPEVQAQLGHSRLSTTGRYLSHVSAEELAARARARAPWTA